MFNPLGALGAFGGGAMEGFGTGMDLMDKYRTQKGQADFMQALQQSLGDVSALGSLGTPDPGTSSERVTMPTPQAPAGPMGPGMQLPQGGFAGSIPGAQPVPQQPGGAQPPGVPQMMASAGSGGIPTQDYVTAVKGFEGYAPQATWDYKQYSGGYGSRAQRGERFSPQTADSRLQDDLYKAAVEVDKAFPGLPQAPRSSLTSFTQNVGIGWAKGPIGQAVRAGDFQRAGQLMQQYMHAGGRVLPGLVQRRQEEGRWMTGQPPSPQALAAGRQAEARAAGQRPVPESVDKGTLGEALRYLQTGQLLPMQHMAQLIERKHPDASPMEKFYAMKAGLKLMNGAGQQQFSQMMQLMQLQQRQQQHEDTLRQQERMEGHRQETEKLREQNYLRRDPYYRREADAASAAQKNLTNNELRTEKVGGHIDALSELVKQVQITGNVTIDSFLQNARSKLGWPSEKFFQYQKQLQDLQSEIAAMGQQTLGALTVSAREDAKQMANGILTPTMLKSLGEAVKIDSKITREASQKIIDKHQRNMNEFMRSGGIPPEAEEEPPKQPAATTGAGADSDPAGLFK